MIDQAELDEEAQLDTSKFLLSPDVTEHSVDPETQARLEALLEAAGNVSFCIVSILVILHHNTVGIKKTMSSINTTQYCCKALRINLEFLVLYFLSVVHINFVKLGIHFEAVTSILYNIKMKLNMYSV